MTRHPILTVVMAVAGVILLLPGVCAAGFIVASGFRNSSSLILGIWAISFLIAAGGGLLLYNAFHQPSDPDDRPTPS